MNWGDVCREHKKCILFEGGKVGHSPTFGILMSTFHWCCLAVVMGKLGENELKKETHWVGKKQTSKVCFLILAFNKFCDFILCLNYNYNKTILTA